MLFTKDGCNGVKGLQLESIRLGGIVGVFFSRTYLFGNAKFYKDFQWKSNITTNIILTAVNKCN